MTAIGFAYGWCGLFWQFDYANGESVRFPESQSAKDHSNMLRKVTLGPDLNILRIRLRFVHTTSREFSSNFVGMRV